MRNDKIECGTRDQSPTLCHTALKEMTNTGPIYYTV